MFFGAVKMARGLGLHCWWLTCGHIWVKTWLPGLVIPNWMCGPQDTGESTNGTEKVPGSVCVVTAHLTNRRIQCRIFY